MAISASCILSKFYIKPQRITPDYLNYQVVSYRNSTSNHNDVAKSALALRLYLIEILHQTTTCHPRLFELSSCILSKFYIKPQLRLERELSRCVVSYRNSTSNHNSWAILILLLPVVSYRNSTSNHNFAWSESFLDALYLIEILHQTTTCPSVADGSLRLYLIEILHQTTTMLPCRVALHRCILSKFYIKPQRHAWYADADERCILSKFYIKPQQLNWEKEVPIVVSYRNSTSNHNRIVTRPLGGKVVSYRNSTSNHNYL